MAKEVDTNQQHLGHPRLLRIGSRRFAFGLFWQSGEDVRHIDAEARAFAQTKNINADLYATRKLPGNSHAQFGVGRRADKLTRGAVAAAAVVANTLRHNSWIGVFAIHNGFWMVMVHDNYILPDGDVFFDKEEHAKEQFSKELNSTSWGKIYAPAHWGNDFDSYEEINIAELLGGARFHGLRLNDISPLRSKLPYLVVGLIGAGLLFGGAFYYKSVQKAEQEAAAERLRQQQLASITQPPKKIVVTPPWYSEPDAGALFGRCIADLITLPIDVPGYDVTEFGCNKTSFYGAYKRDGGIASWFERWLKGRANPNWSYDASPDGDTLNISSPGAALQPRGETPIVSRYEITKSMVERAQTLDDKLMLGQPQQPAPPPGTPVEDWVPPFFAPMEFSIETSRPQLWLRQIENTPGIVISSMTYAQNNAAWTVKGEIYVKTH